MNMVFFDNKYGFSGPRYPYFDSILPRIQNLGLIHTLIIVRVPIPVLGLQSPILQPLPRLPSK